MLYDLVKEGFGIDEDLNCAETILYGANIIYELGLDKNALKLAAGFGGGVGIEDICGALTGSVMVLGNLFVEDRAHENDRIKILSQELINSFQEEMGEIDCAPLKDLYRTEELKCRKIIETAAKILDKIVVRETRLND